MTKRKVEQDEWEEIPTATLDQSDEWEEIDPGEPLFSLDQLGQDALDNVIVPIGRAVDRYTGAPSRAALGAAIARENPVSAFVGQFGDEPEKAPAGKDIARRLGVVDTSLSEVVPGLYSETGEGLELQRGGFLDPTASGVAGLGLDLGTDWTNLVPGALALKGAAKGATGLVGKVARPGARAAAKTTDVLTGTRAGEKSLELAGNLSARARSGIDTILNPKQSPEFAKSVEIARRNEIDPASLSSAIEFGRNSTISRMERGLREGATGEKLFDDYRKGYGEISDAVGRRVERVGSGPAVNEIQAGEIVQQGLKRAQDELFDGADITYKKVQKFAPGLRVNREELAKLESKIGGIERAAKGFMRRGMTGQQRAQGKALLESVDALKATKGGFKQSVEALQMLGRAAFKDKPVIGQVPPDVEKLRDMYFSLSEALIGTVRRDVNPEFADELVANNKAMSEFFQDRKRLMGAFDSSKAGEQVFERFVLNGDSKSIGVLKARLSPDELAKLKGAFLQSLIRTNEEGLVNFNQFANALRGKKNQVTALFDPQEIQELSEVVKLGQDYGPAVLSSSGTGASSGFREFGKALMRGFADEETLDLMKARARGRGAAKKSPSEPAKAGPRVPSVTIDLKNLRRGPVERRLKGLQTIAPSRYDEKTKRRLRALEE
jgi:hypothetical protein